jgi:hypothetical protein
MTMSPEDVARRLRAELDGVPVPERPWVAVRPALVRRRRRRRVMEAVAAGAAVVLVAGLSVAVAGVFGGGPGPSALPRAGSPRYYVQASFPGTAGRPQPVAIRATATGAVTATVRCPWPNSVIAPQGITAAGNHTFFVVCEKVAEQGKLFAVTGARIYRFQLTRSGRISGYSPVPGGVLGRHQPGSITATPDGSQIAVTVGQAALGVVQSVPAAVYVIDTQTGARAIWHGGPKVLGAADLTFTDNGSALEFVGLNKCALGRGGTACEELRTVSPAAAGGQLDSSHVLLPLSALATHPGDSVNDVVINPGGATLAAAIVHSGRRAGSSSVSVVQYSAVNGRQLRVLYHLRTGNGFFYRFLTADPTGRYLIFNAGRTSGTRNGWIDHGRLISLTPANGSNIRYETW